MASLRGRQGLPRPAPRERERHRPHGQHDRQRGEPREGTARIAGEVADSLIFYPIAFYGIWSNEQLISVMIGNYFIKVLWEVLATPLTYLIVGFLKKAEHEDYYDKDTDFNPFSLET